MNFVGADHNIHIELLAVCIQQYVTRFVNLLLLYYVNAVLLFLCVRVKRLQHVCYILEVEAQNDITKPSSGFQTKIFITKIYFNPFYRSVECRCILAKRNYVRQ